MSQRRAVVTGGAGFIGSHLCERLLGAGFAVVCVDNFVTGSEENVEQLADDPSFELVVGDVTEVTDGIQVDGRVDVVLHLASPASPADYLRLPIETLRAGSYGTFNALELARRTGARFVLASTSEVYGDPQVHPQVETYLGHVNTVGPRSVYDEAKRFGESSTRAYRDTHGVDAGIVRIFNTYGPRMRAHDGRAVPTFIRQALAGEPLTVAGDGRQTRSVCFVDDLVDALLRMAESSHAGPVNLGNPHEIGMLDLAETVRRLCGSRSPIAFTPRPVDDPQRRRPDIALAGEVLGWRPTTPLAQGLTTTIAWFARALTQDGTHGGAQEGVPARR